MDKRLPFEIFAKKLGKSAIKTNGIRIVSVKSKAGISAVCLASIAGMAVSQMTKKWQPEKNFACN
jgi:hypothetical protein